MLGKGSEKAQPMVRSRRTTTRAPAPAVYDQAGWPKVLQSLRRARGVTQGGWAALLGVSRTTVQGWERGTGAAPDSRTEDAILTVCRERGLFRAHAHGPLRGLTLTPDYLHALLA